MEKTLTIKNYVIDKFLLFLYYLRLIYIYFINLYREFYEKYLDKDLNEDLIFVKNKEIVNISKNNINSLKADFCVITYQTENQKKIKITDNFDMIDNNNVPEKCMFTFILVTLETNTNKYDITSVLNNNMSTYYLQDSILFDNNFIIWLTIKHLKVPIDTFIINIIDHNANQFTLTNSQFLKLGMNNYHIDQIKQ